MMLDLAGVSLATSFCVASLNAGDDNRENVGYADYFGAAAVMRNVWWEMDFIYKMEAAMGQQEKQIQGFERAKTDTEASRLWKPVSDLPCSAIL